MRNSDPKNPEQSFDAPKEAKEAIEKLESFFQKRDTVDESAGIDLNFNVTRVPGFQAKDGTGDIYMLLVTETIGDECTEDLVIVQVSESMAYLTLAHALLVRAQVAFDKSHGARWNANKNSLTEESVLGAAAFVNGSPIGPGTDTSIETAQGTKKLGDLIQVVMKKEKA